jgi:hypothetical protein
MRLSIIKEQAGTALPPIAFGLVYRRAVVERDASVPSSRRAGAGHGSNHASPDRPRSAI